MPAVNASVLLHSSLGGSRTLLAKSVEISDKCAPSTIDGDESMASELSCDHEDEEILSASQFSPHNFVARCATSVSDCDDYMPSRTPMDWSTDVSDPDEVVAPDSLARSSLVTSDTLREDVLQNTSFPNPDVHCKRAPLPDRDFHYRGVHNHVIPRYHEDASQRLDHKFDKKERDYAPSTMGVGEFERDESATRRTMAMTTERRAALDFLMSRKRSNSFGSEWRQMHSSAPTSPALGSLRGLEVSDFTLEGASENMRERLLRPSSAPVSPVLSSLRQFDVSTDSPPLMVLELANKTATRCSGRMGESSVQIDQEAAESVSTADKPLLSGKKRSVSFGTVQVRSYERILGDNPACTDGPSVSIGWKYAESILLQDVDEYEEQRASTRSQFVPILSRSEREAILTNLGYTRSDIADALRDTTRTRNRRRQTVTNLYAARAEEAAESTTRWMKKRFTIFTKPSRKTQGKTKSVHPKF